MKLIFVTSNVEKLKEAKLALVPYGFEIEGIDFSFKEPYEGSMEDIAKFKLSQIEDNLNFPYFVDDSGIFFKAYGSFPGILTKRIYKLIGYKGIGKLLNNECREAYFHGVIAIKWKDQIKVFHGETQGIITNDIPRDLPNDLQFPFDPIFIPEGSNTVLAEMPVEMRLEYSYRRKALGAMGKWMEKRIY